MARGRGVPAFSATPSAWPPTQTARLISSSTLIQSALIVKNGDFSPRGGGWSHAPLDDEGGSQLGLFDTVQGALMVHFGFTECSVPPKMVVRELIALMVRQGQLITSLADELDLPSDTMTHVFHAAFDRALIGKLDTPEDAFLMDGEAIERFVACFQGGNWSGPRWID